jgi:hypothetical protein
VLNRHLIKPKVVNCWEGVPKRPQIIRKALTARSGKIASARTVRKVMLRQFGKRKTSTSSRGVKWLREQSRGLLMRGTARWNKNISGKVAEHNVPHRDNDDGITWYI